MIKYFSFLFQAAIRRFKPLFDRIVVQKFLPEVVCILLYLFHYNFCFEVSTSVCWEVYLHDSELFVCVLLSLVFISFF